MIAASSPNSVIEQIICNRGKTAAFFSWSVSFTTRQTLLALGLENLKLSQGTDRIKKELEDEEFKYLEKKYRDTSFYLDKKTKTNTFVKTFPGIKIAHSSFKFISNKECDHLKLL